MPIDITITTDVPSRSSTLTIADGECVDVAMKCDIFHSEARQQTWYRQNGYTLPEGLCIGSSVCGRAGKMAAASQDAFANEGDPTTFDGSEEWVGYKKDSEHDQYISVAFDLSELTGGMTIQHARFVLEHDSGSLGDDQFSLYRQATMPTDVGDLDFSTKLEGPRSKEVKADGRVTWSIRSALQSWLNETADGDPAGTVVFVLKVESSSESGDSVKFHSSRNTAGKRGPMLYLIAV